MNSIPTIGLLLLQVTLWLLVGAVLVLAARRRGPRVAAEASVSVLTGVLVLTLLAALPWPGGCRWPVEAVMAGACRLLPTDSTSAPGPGATTVTPIVLVQTTWPQDVASPPMPTATAETAEPIAAAEFLSVPVWARILALGAATLIAAGVLRLLAGLWAVHTCYRRSQPLSDPCLLADRDELARALAVCRPVELRVLSGLGTPATIGWRRPIILLPAQWPDWNPVERRSVLAHELAHVRHGDYGRWLLARLCAALHAYHPLVHWLVRCLRRDQEFAADAAAAPLAGGPNDYAQALCRLALRRDSEERLGLARTFLPVHIPLTRRVQRMLARNDRREKTVSRSARAGWGIALAATALTITGLRGPVEAEAPAPAAIAPADATDVLVTQTYPVADLVIPIDNVGLPASEAGSVNVSPLPVPAPAPFAPPVATPSLQAADAQAAPAPVPLASANNTATLEHRLMRLIVKKVAPASWSEHGGRGTIDYYPLGMALVIRQTPAIHAQITELLAGLRRAQDLEVSLEVRFISVAEAMMKRLARDFNIETKATEGEPLNVSDAQLFLLIEALQGDRRTNVMQAPKLTLFNGQLGSIQIQDFEKFVTNVQVVEQGGQVVFVPQNQSFPIGLDVQTQPVVSADRRYVRLKLKANLTELKSDPVRRVPLKISVTPIEKDGADGKPQQATQELQAPEFTTIRLNREMTIPNGKTALLNGGKGVFRLALDGKEKPQERYLLVAVTPRIIVASEEETGGNPNPAYRQVEQLLKKYHQACLGGRHEEARQLAVQALALDPTCFSPK
jgi:beta-lactamase regulating signal transducer with metallopeptidase domain